MVNQEGEKPEDERALQFLTSLADGEPLQETGFQFTRGLTAYIGKLGFQMEQIAKKKQKAIELFMQGTAFLETEAVQSICERERQRTLSEPDHLPRKIPSEFIPLYRKGQQVARSARWLAERTDRMDQQADDPLVERLDRLALYLDAVTRTLRDRQQDRGELQTSRSRRSIGRPSNRRGPRKPKTRSYKPSQSLGKRGRESDRQQ